MISEEASLNIQSAILGVVVREVAREKRMTELELMDEIKDILARYA